MTQAIRIHEYGGPEVLRFETVPTPEPGVGQIQLRQEAIGLNYIDVYFRTGFYKIGLPATLGMEAAGRVTALGEGVLGFRVGDRVAYASGPVGAYATSRVISADRCVGLPDDLDTGVAAACMLQGLTAHYLLHRTFRVQPGHIILVHAAAGGVGLLLCQWASHLGARVIGVVSTPEKAALAREYGAAETIIGIDRLPEKVADLTGGAKVPVVYDSVGRDTFVASLDCLAPLGMMVSFGSASGPVPPVEVALLATKGSLFLTRPTLATYMAARRDLVAAASDLFGAIATGVLKVRIGQRFALKDAAAAHAALEARQTTGSTVLLP
jgi:NADPH2:quinone reductase